MSGAASRACVGSAELSRNGGWGALVEGVMPPAGAAGARRGRGGGVTAAWALASGQEDALQQMGPALPTARRPTPPRRSGAPGVSG